MERVVFVYAKEGKIKVLEIERAKILHEELKAGGWEHTATLDVINWIEYLHNTCSDFESEVKHLSGEKVLKPTPAGVETIDSIFFDLKHELITEKEAYHKVKKLFKTVTKI